MCCVCVVYIDIDIHQSCQQNSEDRYMMIVNLFVNILPLTK